MFAFKGISVSKVFQAAAAAASSISKYLIMKLTGEGYNKDNNKVFLDESNNYFGPITTNGNAAQGSAGPFGTNWSWYFDGTGDYLTASVNASALAFGTGDFTLECWSYVSSAPNLAYIADARTGAAWAFGWGLISPGQLSWFNGAGASVTYSTTVPLNSWNHIAIVRAGSTMTLYLNGVSVATGSDSTNYTATSGNCTIGARYTAADYYLGYISNLRVVKGTAVYTTNFTPSISALTNISGTSLLTCQNGYLYDNSNNRFTITVNGDAQSRPFGPFDQSEVSVLPYRSVLFNGTTDYLSTATSANLSIASNTDWTVEMWVLPLSFASAQCLFFSSTGATSSWVVAHNFAAYLSSTNGFLTIEYSNGSVALNTTGTVGARLNQWNHLAIVYNGTAKTLTSYMNGVRDFNATSLSSYAPPGAAPRVTIGRTDAVVPAGTAYFVNGYISNYRLVRGSQVYSGASITVPTSPLTAITGTALLTCQGNTFADGSANNLTITGTGSPRVTANSPFSLSTTTTSTTAVTQSWSGFFDGTGDALTVADNDAFNFGSGNFTVEYWMYPTSVSSNWIVNQWESAAGTETNSSFVFLFNASSKLQAGVAYNNTTNQAFITSNTTITPNRWYHVALVRSGSTLSLYLDGALEGTNTAVGATVVNNSNLNINIGQRQGASNFYAGYLSNLRIVKGTAVYTTSFTPSTTDLTAVAGTSLLALQGQRFIDGSSNNFAIAQSGDVKTTMFGPFLSTGSMFFDGTGDYINYGGQSAFAFGTGDFTVETWFYLANTGFAMLFDCRPNGDNTSTNFCLYHQNTNNTIRVYVNADVLTSTTTIAANHWYHVAVSRQGTTMRLFINGALEASVSNSTNFAVGASRPTIGASGVSTAAGNLNGYLSNMRVVKGTAVYTAAFTPPTANLTNIANTSLLLQGVNNFTDTSSNNFTPTLNGNVRIHTNNNGLPLSPYASNNSVQFAGNGGLSANTAALAIGTSDFTLEMWVYPTAASVTSALFDTRSPDTTAGFNIYLSGSAIIVGTTGANWISDTTGFPLSNNNWYHIALTRVGSNMRLFLNGAQIGSTYTSATQNLSNTTTRIGTGLLGNFSGYMSNVRLIKGTALYVSQFTPPSEPLTAVSGTVYLTCQSSRFIDNSSTNAAISITAGTPSINTAFVPTNNLYSLFFNGSSDYITSTASNLYAFGTGDFTVEAWVYPTARANYSHIVGPHNFGVGANWYMLLRTAGTIEFYISTGNSTSPVTLTSTTAVPLNQWSHLAVTRSGTAVRMFINGVDVGGGTSSNNVGQNYNLGIGCAANGSGSFFSGYISNVRITKGTALYTSAFTPSTAPLTTSAQTVLLTGQGNSFTDASGNNVFLTPVSTVRTDPFTPFRNTISSSTSTTSGTLLSGSYFFDGTGDYLSIPASTAFLAAASEDYTIEFWWRPTALPTGAATVPLSAGYPTVAASAFLFYYDPLVSPKRLSYYSSSNGSSWNIASNQTIVASPVVNQWYHVAVSRRNGVIRLFSNGVLVTTINSTAAMYSAVLYPITVGAAASGNNAATGFVSNLRILRGAGLYTNTFTPPATPGQTLGSSSLTLNFRAAGIYDSVSDTIFETLGDAAISTVQKRNGNTSMFFSGTGDYLTATNRDLAWGTGDFTVEFWMYSANVSAASQRGPLQTSTTAGGLVNNYTSGLALALGTTCSAGGVFTATNGGIGGVLMGTNFGSPTAVLTANTWTHIAVVRRSGVVTLYVNGSSVDSRTISTSVTATNIAIGGYYSTSYLYNGYLDDLQIYSGYAKYTGNFTPT